MSQTFKLPVGNILLGAMSIAWLRRRRYFDALTVPLLLFVLAWALSAVLGERMGGPYSGWLILPVYAAGFALFAVACHRFVLIDEHRTLRERFVVGLRELRFLGWLIGASLIMFVVQALVISTLINLPGMEGGNGNGAFKAMQQIGSIPAYYVLGRISLVFPATAIDRPAGLAASWRMTQGNGWRMFVVVGLFPWLIDSVLSLVWREDATVVEETLLSLVGLVGFSMTIFALSFAYREIERRDGVGGGSGK